MKKIIFLITFLLFIPIINAEEFLLQKDNIYDYANAYNESELERLDEIIKEFELKSSIDLNVITVSSRDELVSLYEKLSSERYTNNKSLYLPRIVMIVDINGSLEISTNSYYNDVWDNKHLQKFHAYKIIPYDNIYAYPQEIDIVINKWIDYFDSENQINIMMCVVISLLVTLVFMIKLTKKYRVKLITEADKYINQDKIIVK